MKTLVVVLFVDNVDMTLKCLKSVSDTLLSSDDMLLIDNGSKITSFQKMSRKYSGTIIRRNDKNIANGWNTGIDVFLENGYENLCIIHNDTEFQKGWMTELKLAFDIFPDCGVSFARQVSNIERYAVYDKKFPLGFCFLLKRNTIEKAGKFNPDFILKPDLEYFKRVRECGLKLVVCSGCSVAHVGGGTTSSLYSLTFYMEELKKEFVKMGLAT